MEEITLEKIDLLRERTGIGYAEAKKILEMHNGSIVDALIYFESDKNGIYENVEKYGQNLKNTVKSMIEMGNTNRLKVKQDNHTVIDVPVNKAIIVGGLSLFNPILLGASIACAIASNSRIEIEKPNGRSECLGKMVMKKTEDIVEDVSSKAEDAFNEIKDKTQQVFNQDQ